MMKRLGCLLLALALAGSLSGCGSSGPAEGQTFAMDTVMNFSAYGKTGEMPLRLPGSGSTSWRRNSPAPGRTVRCPS